MGDKSMGGKRLIDSVLDLFNLVAVYLQQEIKRIVDQGITRPIGIAARKAALYLLAFTLFSIASVFIAVGLFLTLANLIGFAPAYLLIGVVFILVGLLAFSQSRREPKK